MDTEVLRKWLKAGFLEKHVLFATTEGTPQGGIVSPALANRALDGLQSLLEHRFSDTRRKHAGSKVHLVRYADDFIVTGTSRVLLQTEVQPLVAQFLRQRGLELSHEKTRITHIDDGFDFLGQTVRRFANGKVLIKPSKRSVKTFLSKIQATIDDASGLTVGLLIRRLNQQIKGWTMYHRYAVSKSHLPSGGQPDLPKADEMVSLTPSQEELEVDQAEILPTRGQPVVGVHGNDP